MQSPRATTKTEQIRSGAERKDSGQIFLVASRHTHRLKEDRQEPRLAPATYASPVEANDCHGLKTKALLDLTVYTQVSRTLTSVEGLSWVVTEEYSLSRRRTVVHLTELARGSATRVSEGRGRCRHRRSRKVSSGRS